MTVTFPVLSDAEVVLVYLRALKRRGTAAALLVMSASRGYFSSEEAALAFVTGWDADRTRAAIEAAGEAGYIKIHGVG